MATTDVLVLDDETPILKAIARTLLGGLDITLETTPDPRRAVEVLGARPPRVLITDYSMPGMNGVEVLEEARRVAPDTVRILLTAHAERAHIIDAINSGRIFRFIPKPWDNDALVGAVREALDAHEMLLHGRRVKHAVEHAGDVQRSLLPAGRFHIDGVEAACFTTPCEYATGDYVDVFPLPSGNVALLLGDVCGHGIGAALFMFTARALLHSGLAEGGDLVDVLERANRFLCRDMSAGRFLTLFAAVHDARDETLRYVNGGHTAPLLLAAGGGVKELRGNAMPLGLMEETSYRVVATVPFSPGETVVAYTDGLTEARNARQEFFGPERLVELLHREGGCAPEVLVERIRDACHDFVGRKQVQDDLTLLAYRPLIRPTGPAASATSPDTLRAAPR